MARSPLPTGAVQGASGSRRRALALTIVSLTLLLSVTKSINCDDTSNKQLAVGGAQTSSALPATSSSVSAPNGSSSSNPKTVAPATQASSGSAGAAASGSDDDERTDEGSKLKQEFDEADLSIKNKTSTVDSEKHQFYKPEYITEPERAMGFWVDFSKPQKQGDRLVHSTKHEMLSKSHRRAAPIKLSFDFPFYGQNLRNIIIATGGFLYLGDHLHHWLAATQNISPLMANFDLSLTNHSDLHYFDNGTALVVQWLDVQMKDNKPPGNFSFQVTLFKNGDIVFVYKHLPVQISDIPEDDHPVKVGISDAFLMDNVSYFIRRKTIYDYHRLNLKERARIGNQTAVYLKALPTCTQHETCDTCARADPDMECVWCAAVKRCSNGLDRKRQEWMKADCASIKKFECSSASSADSAASSEQPAAPFKVTPSPAAAAGSSSARTGGNGLELNLPPADRDARASGGYMFFSLLFFFGLTAGLGLWVFQAYKNPHTPSGQLLIKYRPSNWRWQAPETRYTAASIHM